MLDFMLVLWTQWDFYAIFTIIFLCKKDNNLDAKIQENAQNLACLLDFWGNPLKWGGDTVDESLRVRKEANTEENAQNLASLVDIWKLLDVSTQSNFSKTIAFQISTKSIGSLKDF